jgi:putative FmdB family regulatory protein
MIAMPTYEYSCPECQEEFELMRPMSECDAPATCPHCGATAKKIVSVFASKADYTIKVPSKPAFRGEKPKAAEAPAKPAGKAGAKAGKKATK